MKLKFDSTLGYQLEAIKSVTDRFEGLPPPAVQAFRSISDTAATRTTTSASAMTSCSLRIRC